MTRALITGVTGQDGSYLAEFLLEKGYDVHAIYRRVSTETFERLKHIKDKISLICADLMDQTSLNDTIKRVKPDEIYNLAAQSFVPESWTQPILTANVTALGALRVLDALKHINPKIKIYQASSSEMFGKVRETPQTEKTPFYPRSPYGVSKVFAYWMMKNYRESYGMFCANGILFNHESPRRGFQFVTRKVTDAAARIKLGLQKEIKLGNLEAKRDWGYAKDYVEAMWLMLRHDKPDDFVIATGETHSVRELCEIAFDRVGLNYRDFVRIDKKFIRPAEVDILIGDYSKAKKDLGWEPKVKFKELIEIMVDSDLNRYKKNESFDNGD
ncbi:GDP-mannose 4,6-dehydratase [Candidatus Woesearchaeota archaeon]|nr:GDP-mannose 4,6-dehydratase [Candidatus Woesearchaeota archaeon]